MDLPKTFRKCAFCLDVDVQATKLCGKCRKRAYCSRKCQVADWSSNGTGQGHKNWCNLECGEEDLDWEVKPLPGKGLGLIAKRTLPAKYRIIVDGCRSKDHPAIKDLMPLNGTYYEKFQLNALGCGDNEECAICLRVSRANHNCNANADHVYDKTFNVIVLFAQHDIAEGDEICINYQSHSDISRNVTADEARMVLRIKWGIICADNCFCRDKKMEKLIARSRELDKEINILASQGHPRALDVINELLNNHEILNSSFLNKKRTLYDGFQTAIMRKRTLKSAETFIAKLYAIESAIMSPESSEVLERERLMKDITGHRNYLLFD